MSIKIEVESRLYVTVACLEAMLLTLGPEQLTLPDGKILQFMRRELARCATPDVRIDRADLRKAKRRVLTARAESS